MIIYNVDDSRVGTLLNIKLSEKPLFVCILKEFDNMFSGTIYRGGTHLEQMR